MLLQLLSCVSMLLLTNMCIPCLHNTSVVINWCLHNTSTGSLLACNNNNDNNNNNNNNIIITGL